MRAVGSVNRERERAAELLPLVYDELRCLARSSMARLRPGQTSQPTGLVHEAWLKTVGGDDPGWDNAGHFFGAAAQAMRQIIVDQIRRKTCMKRGAGAKCVGDPDSLAVIEPDAREMLALDEALAHLERESSRKYDVVMLKFFAGLNDRETAQLLNVSERTVERDWRFARAWLHKELGEGEDARERGRREE